MTAALVVAERGTPLAFGFDDLLRYHGAGSPGGVAHVYKVLERALPLLSPHAPPERREITVRTAFRGPGARDGIELVTRAVTDGRFAVDAGLERPEHGTALERFVFELSYRGCAVTLAAREGYVLDELIELVRRDHRSAGEDRRVAVLKQRMADLVMGAPADEVYDATVRR